MFAKKASQSTYFCRLYSRFSEQVRSYALRAEAWKPFTWSIQDLRITMSAERVEDQYYGLSSIFLGLSGNLNTQRNTGTTCLMNSSSDFFFSACGRLLSHQKLNSSTPNS